MGYSQEFLDMKLMAIREAMNRAPVAVKPPKTKPVKLVKPKPIQVKKPGVVKPVTKSEFEPTGFKSKPMEKVFATKPLNLEDKIKIEVKRGLWIYVNAGDDIEAIKAKYTAPKKLVI